MHATPRKRLAGRLATAAVLAATAGVLTAAPAGAAIFHHGNRTVDVQLLSFNDLHGNLEAPQGSSGTVTEDQPDGTKKVIPAGGMEYLASALRSARAGHEYSITAAAGDMVGASPLMSGLFHDEPTIEALNKLKLDATSVGNHEFDEGKAELQRMQRGGCHPKDGCFEKRKKFRGADFSYLAANVTEEKTGKQILKPYTIWRHKGVKVGIIGLTLEGTPDVVTAQGVKGLKFADEVATINKYANELDRKGVKAIVTLVHEGGMPASGSYNYDCDTPGAGAGISGPIVDIAKKVTPKVDALITGHTHQAYNCTIPDPAGNPRTVTSASSFGRLYTDTTLKYDRRTKDFVRTPVQHARAANHVVDHDRPKAADMTALIDRWKKLAAPVANRAVGYISADINGRGSEAYEKPLGDVIADAQLEAHAPADKGGAQIAFMNAGGVRSDLAFKASGDEGDGVVTYGEAFTVQPFTNMTQVADLTGAQVISVLQQQVSGAVNGSQPKILQISKGLTYTLDMKKTGADRLVVSSVKLNGEAIDPAKTYRVAANEFLMGGGDGFPAFKEAKNKLNGVSDLDAFLSYLGAHSSKSAPLDPPKAERITIVK
ncbi:bifunctional metallophosphatase/5'-nucleotidase [Streptomyces sp. AV19]|uniref:bifunctional metallophosphatase/5'-nucleotidase n=1 Tax=Streptomyces sp. AV19 TaxID=2793068 RepID=UPI0018FE9805|nr:bifunctional metallophosphatase/5'-nucleotidase [Streptomyces sp. AV19]MBH1936140.1 bifunctional metallophosphatase/5'-nucleotidase [Streptomyces sp. AV19]MDG4534064.1 bifunctional metallophosphatase/5'-nucleotidase [Streptomyces sp. AV19]